MTKQRHRAMLEHLSNVGTPIREVLLPEGSDRAGVNIAIEYVLSVAVFLALTGALTAGLSSTVDTSQENVAQVELNQASNEIAVAIEDVDRAVRDMQTRDAALPGTAGEMQAQIKVELPERAGTEPYVIRVSDGEVIVETDVGTGVEAESVTSYQTTADVETVGGVTGGSLVISYNAASGEIEVANVGS